MNKTGLNVEGRLMGRFLNSVLQGMVVESVDQNNGSSNLAIEAWYNGSVYIFFVFTVFRF